MESFTNASGSALTGQSGGSGWLGSWTAGTGGIAGFTVGPGLAYSNLTTAGNGIQDTSGSELGNTRQWFDPTTTFTNGTTIWFSFLVKYNVNHNSDVTVAPFGQSGSKQDGYGVTVNCKALANSPSGSASPRVYLRGDGSTYGVGNSTAGPGLPGAAAFGTPFLVIGRFVLSTNSNGDTLDVWANQTWEPTNNSALRLTNFTAFRKAPDSEGRLLLYSGFSAQDVVDEIRIGTTYAAVTQNLIPTPPPSVTLFGATNNSMYVAPAVLNLSATVVTNGHAITKVQFCDGGTVLFEDSTPPYAYTWNNVPVGIHNVSARLVYDNGLALGSAFNDIYVFDVSPVTVGINVQSNRRPISPLIYGCNWAKSNELAELNYPLNRRGGEVESRYNWQLNAHNLCKNWYFISMRDGTGATPGADADLSVAHSHNAGADCIILIPMIGWMPRLKANGDDLWSYSIAKYGAQTGHEPYGTPDAGNGTSAATGQYITWNDPNDASFFTNSLFQAGYVKHLTNRWGTAAQGGVRFYTMDNEPFLWDYIHRDVQQSTVTRELVRDRLFEYSPMVKSIDPGAEILAPNEWGFSEAESYYPWLLGQYQHYQNTNGTRLLDYLTLHYYQAYNAGEEGTLPRLLQANRSTRSLWDSNYNDESWINKKINLIPTMKGWVSSNYPGTKIGITEYNWGYKGHIAGAVLQAEVLGLFGREGLDLATRWDSSANNPTNVIFKAMKMYRNYDGNKSTFGDTSVSASSATNPDDLSAFAAERAQDGALTVMVMNKQPIGSRAVTLSLSNFVHNGTAEVWQLTANNVITKLPNLAVSGNSVTTTLPMQSVTLLVMGSGAPILVGTASHPVPTDGATGVALNPALAWTPGTNATQHLLYLGTSSNAVALATTNSPEFLGVTTTTNFAPGTLAYLTTYHWRVDERANSAPTVGSVWRFTTVATPPLGSVTLTNADAFGSSSLNAKLNWNDSVAPNAGNHYFTSGHMLRTPNNTSDITFLGHALTINTNASGTAGSLLLKSSGAGYDVTITNLTLDGGILNQGQNTSSNVTTTFSLKGSQLSVTADSTIKATPNTGDIRALVIHSPLVGSRTLVYTNDGTSGVFQVTLAGDNSGFSGTNLLGAAPGSAVELRLSLTSDTSLGTGPMVLGSGNLSLENTSGTNVTLFNSISGPGGLSVSGTTPLVLAGTNIHTGATTVRSGGLLVNGSLGNCSVSVSNGALLGGDGVLAGPVTVSGLLAPGAAGIGRLTISNSLTLAGGTVFELTKSPAPANDMVIVTGTLNAGGTLTVTNLGGALVPGDTFALFNKAVSGNFAAFIPPALPAGWEWTNRLALDGTIAVVASTTGPATDPSPADGAVNVAIAPTLTWTPGANATGHQIYFGADSNAVATATTNAVEFQGTQAGTSYAPGTLAHSGRFYWRVDELGVASSTNGVVWTFASASNPTNTFTIGGSVSGGFTISFPSQIGQTYRVERTGSLSPPDWQTLSNNIPGTGGLIQLADPLPVLGEEFYRAVIQSP